MYNSYMSNDKLVILTYKNTIYQSKLKLLAISGQNRFSSTVRFSDRRNVHQRTDSTRAQFIIRRRSYLDWLELQSLFCLDISPLIYLFVCSSSISPKFPLFNHKYIYWKRVNSYWYGGPHLISDFDFIISVYMLYILCVKCKFSLSIMLCQFIIINNINNNSLNIKP